MRTLTVSVLVTREILALIQSISSNPLGVGAQMFANRLDKNLKHLKRWITRENIQCYRLYDADMPEYALAIDIYESNKRMIHVQEYQAPKSVDPEKAQQRLDEALIVIQKNLQVVPKQVFLKTRRQQKGHDQYEKLASKKCFHPVTEGGYQFLVNFEDYLDTGLFLDHRRTRSKLSALAKGKRFLNLFAYTGTATVYAARGGALSTTSVDMSNTYLDWAQKNMQLNGFSRGQSKWNNQHRFVQADCLQWLEDNAYHDNYDLIFLDPPSFSRSKRMSGTFDVQRDHAALLLKTVQRLTPNGLLIFSNNLRHFKMDAQILQALQVKDISKATLPKDFERTPRIHNCWEIRLKS